eukprot:CAMPEP_0176498502 /NCGR_PEP_ID=MMETSP0200_2-20121128/12359_1 /TAXON_ID=947934 /ORGANISM="Chaetoceros sp., Strain GSL56" /LENGTH=368 /DNA_ID=CAMNT_0017896721 /DNA_START=358 /DNA_END=1464 /DNA_ORIENTATION=-
MAAVICKTLGDCCGGCCRLFCAPFRLCCDATASLCTNPFCLYVATTVGLNIPPIAISAGYLVQDFMNCTGSMWLLVNSVLCAINIAAAFYVAIKYRDPNSAGGGEARSGFQRAKDILCYDPTIAIYIIILFLFFVWLCLGFSWRFSDDLISGSGSDDVGCSENTASLMSTCIGLGFTFLSLGCIALCISLCCSCCLDFDKSGGTASLSPSAAAQPLSSSYNNNSQHTNSNNANNNNNNAASHDLEYGTHKKPTAAATTTTTAIPVYDGASSQQQNHVLYATVIEDDPEPSAPPLNTIQQHQQQHQDEISSLDEDTKAAASGVKIGGKIGTLFNASDQTKAKIENVGAKASVAANKGLRQFKKMTGLSR